jgi:hypothetical protein
MRVVRRANASRTPCEEPPTTRLRSLGSEIPASQDLEGGVLASREHGAHLCSVLRAIDHRVAARSITAPLFGMVDDSAP